MDSQKSREIILNKIKKSVAEGRDFPIPSHNEKSPVFPEPENLLETFSDELKAIGGKVEICDNQIQFVERLENILGKLNIKSIFSIDTEINTLFDNSSLKTTSEADDFKDMQAAVTLCEYLVSRTGSVVISSQQPSGRRLNVFPPIHIVFAKASQLVPFPDDALNMLEERYGDDFPSLISFITGASRTADIEKTLVMGAHGPKELFVFIDKNA